MGIYIILVLVLFLLTKFEYYEYKRRRLLFVFFLLWLIVGLRGYSVGTDTYHYIIRFEEVEYYSHLKNLEYGWYFLSLIIKRLKLDVQWLFIISSLISLSVMFYAFWLKSKNIMFSILLYVLLFYYFESFNTCRQTVAVSMMLVSICNYCDRKYYGYAMWMFFGVLFHTSALAGLLFPFVKMVKMKKLPTIVFLVLSLVLGLFDMGGFFNQFDVYMLTDTYSHYFDDFSKNTLTISRILMNVFVMIILFSIKGEISLLEKMLLVGIMLQNAFPYPIIIRFFEYFIFTILFVIPNLVISYKKESILLYATLFYAISKFTMFLFANVSGVVPYKFFFEL